MKSRWWLFALVSCLLVASFAPLASSSPDGLERVAEDKGFISRATEAPYKLIADYIFPGVENEALATILAGVTGTVLVFALVYGAAWLLVSRKNDMTRHKPGE